MSFCGPTLEGWKRSKRVGVFHFLSQNGIFIFVTVTPNSDFFFINLQSLLLFSEHTFKIFGFQAQLYGKIKYLTNWRNHSSFFVQTTMLVSVPLSSQFTIEGIGVRPLCTFITPQFASIASSAAFLSSCCLYSGVSCTWA